MKENFDERLTNKIKTLFDNYQEDYQDANWIVLKARIEKKKTKKIIIWRQSLKLAAILIPLCALACWYALTLDFKPDYAQVSESQIANSDSVKAIQRLPEQENEETIVNLDHQGDNLPHKDNLENEANSEISSPELIAQNITAPTNKHPDIEQQFEEELRSYDSIIARLTRRDEGITNTSFISRLKRNQDLILDMPLEEFRERSLGQMDDALAAYFTLDNPVFLFYDTDANLNPEKDHTKQKDKISYGLAIASMYNYTGEASSNSALNYGGSLMTEIPFAKNFSISSGVMLSRQSFALEDPTLFTPSVSIDGVQDFQETDIDLLALDIPINLSYNFRLPKQKTINLTAGLSSLVYLKESLTNNYAVTTTEVQINTETFMSETVTVTEQFQETNEQEALNRFDFARLFNFSVGMSYPISSRFHLQFEPYIKYPIGELTNSNLKFGMGGVQLRLKFK